ncbi:MAG: fumarate reductase/succinate dehydrogenase flavoprotein subunit, partial [Thermoanaerobaculia bacterium]
IRELRAEFWSGVKVPGENEELNQALEKAGRIADFFELAELMCIDALDRDESCGGHLREEHQTLDGEALRDDERFSFVSAWQWNGAGKAPARITEPLEFEYVKPTQRSYK